MTAAVFGEGTERDGLDIMAPERVATCVSFLAAPAAEKVNGQVFIVYGDMVALMAPPVVQEKFVAANGSFSVAELAEQVVPYIEDLPEGQSYAATSINALDTTGAIAGGQ